jgi:hypothetical protein
MASLMPWAIYTPSIPLFEVARLCGSTEEFKTLKIISKPQKWSSVHPKDLNLHIS